MLGVPSHHSWHPNGEYQQYARGLAELTTGSAMTAEVAPLLLPLGSCFSWSKSRKHAPSYASLSILPSSNCQMKEDITRDTLHSACMAWYRCHQNITTKSSKNPVLNRNMPNISEHTSPKPTFIQKFTGTWVCLTQPRKQHAYLFGVKYKIIAEKERIMLISPPAVQW